MALSASDLSTLSRLLDDAMELPALDVEAWLRDLPEEHARLASQLREMLASRTGATGFLAAGPSLGADETVARPGDRVGPYRLVREIGKGGMGAVWLAEQVDGRLKRNIALKLPRLAWGSRLAERMARERDIGALLEHPNIARLYDAGVDDRGRPYLALEYIDGISLDQWCRDKALSIPDKLHLFIQVARAVAYAHGRLVVHRDLKPSNVLVTADGQAHLLDFGIAKLLDDASAGANLTQEQGRLMTPGYASPEQKRGGPITVSSDVYSLGVLLFELLTSQLPYGSRRSSIRETQAGIPDDDPAPCSSRALDKQTAKYLTGELDAIAAKALKTDPVMRYPTADAFADDVQRHLKGERVLARPDSSAYRIRRIVKRHRLALASATVVLATVLIGSTVTLLQANRALRAAERERLVKEFVSELFRANAKGEGITVKTRRTSADLMLENGAALIEARFPRQPELQIELYGLVSDVFSEMGVYPLAIDYGKKQLSTMQASAWDPERQRELSLRLGEALLNDDRFLEAAATVQQVLDTTADTSRRRSALVLLGRIALKRGKFPEVEARLAQSRAIRAVESIDDAWMEELEAYLLISQNRIEAAMARFHSSVDTAVRLRGANSRDVAELRMELAFWLLTNHRDEEGLKQVQAALQVLESASQASAVRAAATRAFFWYYMRKVEAVSIQEALSVVRNAQRYIDNSSVIVPDSVTMSIDFYEGDLLRRSGDLQKAEQPLSRSVATLKRLSQSPGELFIYTSSEIWLRSMRGDHDQARSLMGEMHRFRTSAGQADTPWATSDYRLEAMNETMAGEFERAQAVLDHAPTAAFNPADVRDGSIYPQLLRWERVRLFIQQGDYQGALSLVEQLDDGPEVTWLAFTRALRGECLCASGRSQEGLAFVEKAIELKMHEADWMDPELARDRAVAGNCALDRHDRATAIAMAQASAAAFEYQPGVSPYYKDPLRRLAVRLRMPLGLSLR